MVLFPLSNKSLNILKSIEGGDDFITVGSTFLAQIIFVLLLYSPDHISCV